MILKHLVGAVPLWLAVCATVLVCCSAMPPDSEVGTRSDAGLPAELIPGEHRGPTFEELVERLNRPVMEMPGLLPIE